MPRSKKELAILLLIPVILSLFFFPQKLYAATLFEDNFDTNADGTIPDKWQSTSNVWSVQNKQYGVSFPGVVSNSFPTDSNWNFSNKNIQFEVDLTEVAGVDKNVIVKYVDNSNFIEVHTNNEGTHLEKYVSGSSLPFFSYLSQVYLGNGAHHYKIIIEDLNITVYIDGGLVFDKIPDTGPIFNNWKVGLRTGGNVQVWFDNVLVTDLPPATPTPSPFPSISVPDVKQYSAPWGLLTYDDAKKWFPSDPTITRWGCSLTSADMILQKNGFNINPGDLNEWLNSQQDGYIPNGQLNWIAVSRYSKINSTNTKPALEYKKVDTTNQALISELTAGKPVIAEEPGHFVVVKSQTSSSFGINDPAYTNHPTLSSYGNSYLSLRDYTPSHTDLSYIMLTINPNFDLKVFDTNGNEILGDTYIQSPLIDDVANTNTSGNSIKIFEFPKPSNGNYDVQVNGDGIYELDSYLYDVNGNVSMNKFKGIVSSGQVDDFQVTIGPNNSSQKNVTIDGIIQDWEDAENQGRIRSDKLYKDVRTKLNVIKILLNNQLTKSTKVILDMTNQVIQSYVPDSIDSPTALIVQSELQSLLNSL